MEACLDTRTTSRPMMIDELLVDFIHIQHTYGLYMYVAALQTLCYQSVRFLLFNSLINTLLTQFDVVGIDGK